jgi:GNAT superfamily N-acetyltransferase
MVGVNDEVRRLRQDEATRLRELRLRALADAGQELGPFLEEEREFPPSYWQAIADDTKVGHRRVSFVGGGGDGLVGMVGAGWDAQARRVHLVALWVDPARRGEGTGAALVEAVVGWAAEHRGDGVELWVVDEASHAAALYSACGFVDSGVRQTVPYSPQQMEKLLVRRL